MGGMSMVLPMNMTYRANFYYHEFVFLLQFAAFAAMLCTNYGYTLDAKTASGLQQMKVCVTITFVTMAYSRGFRYVFVGYKLISTFYNDDSMKILCAGSIVLGLVALFNILLIGDA